MTPLATLALGLAVIVAFLSPIVAIAIWVLAVALQLLAQAGYGVGVTETGPVEPFGPEE